jgi:hypothetical protein
MKFETLDAVGDAFITATDVETEALFEQGRIVLAGVQSGFAVDDVTRHCAGLVRRTSRTIYRRYAVARTFPESHPELTWEFHGLCADLVDYRQADEKQIALEQEQAQAWLNRAAEEHYSTRTLRAALIAAGGRIENKPVVLLNGVDCQIEYIEVMDDGTIVKLFVPSEFLRRLACDTKEGTKVVATVVLKAPSVEGVKS